MPQPVEKEQTAVAAKNFDGFAQAVDTFLSDVTYMEPRLLTMYDEVLPRIDRALGTSARREATPR
jgi:hypothetical protein